MEPADDDDVGVVLEADQAILETLAEADFAALARPVAAGDVVLAVDDDTDGLEFDGVHGGEYMRKFNKAKADLGKSMNRLKDIPVDLEDEEEKPRGPGVRGRAYKDTAIGNMLSVSGASFQDIAAELGFSVAGAKQARL